ncbi:hypothetical protein BEWA_007650 [Theileria equi strain WA]|uniref:CRAL-TRIO domain-containing protein n=1 Tax=Theileria equi strain WA TaxID=1537102 RepID=L0B294_THEEQ|nr:hypothetical protein BEWA_007650 [Theileria equi strain WA]AFZ81356.1 hypothetical protein BEWA_007650 [Theileria equi strain WA]|eukprot:XP_004831022.1 hypothetical protein BEWA_007650 [Theileria equi strain WA]
MDFFKSFKTKRDSNADNYKRGTVDTDKSSATNIEFNYESICPYVDHGPFLTDGFHESTFELKDFLKKWNKHYSKGLKDDEELIISQISGINGMKKLLSSLPHITDAAVPKKSKWSKLSNVEPAKDITINELYWCTDIVLFRYLRSYDYKVESAFKMLLKTLTWRRMRTPSDITPDTVKPSLVNGMLYRKGYDFRGSPLIYFRPYNETPVDPEIHILGIYYTIERATQTIRLSEGNDKVYAIIDLKDWSLSRIPSMELLIETVRALSDHYSDVLDEVIIVDSPMFINTVLQMVKCVLHQSTSNKILLKQRGDSLNQYLRQRIPLPFLEETLGGNCHLRFNADIYWDVEQSQFKEYQDRRKKWIDSNRASFFEGKETL